MSRAATGDAPRVVAIGGGHGLAQTLKAARRYAVELTAVVSVADDGGSSGRLRELPGIPAPGDLRRCIGALLPEPSPLGDALEHRFASGELIGQVRVSKGEAIATVLLVPPGARPPRAVLQAIAEADQIVLGPGSLFTSVLAACVVPGIREALSSTRAKRVYVANLREQLPETAGFDVARLVEALRVHGVDVDVVSADAAGLPVGEFPVDTALVIAEVGSAGLREHDPKLLGAELALLVNDDVLRLARPVRDNGLVPMSGKAVSKEHSRER